MPERGFSHAARPSTQPKQVVVAVPFMTTYVCTQSTQGLRAEISGHDAGDSAHEC